MCWHGIVVLLLLVQRHASALYMLAAAKSQPVASTHPGQERCVLVQAQHNIHIVEQHQAGQRGVRRIIQAAEEKGTQQARQHSNVNTWSCLQLCCKDSEADCLATACARHVLQA